MGVFSWLRSRVRADLPAAQLGCSPDAGWLAPGPCFTSNPLVHGALQQDRRAWYMLGVYLHMVKRGNFSFCSEFCTAQIKLISSA